MQWKRMTAVTATVMIAAAACGSPSSKSGTSSESNGPAASSHFKRDGERRQLDEPAVAQRIGGQQLARERQAEILFGRLKHQPGIVEHRHHRHLGGHTGRGKPVLP